MISKIKNNVSRNVSFLENICFFNFDKKNYVESISEEFISSSITNHERGKICVEENIIVRSQEDEEEEQA
jgi:hypothetical protein